MLWLLSPLFNFSGSLLMHGMIPCPMHTTVQCHACLEGKHVEVLSVFYGIFVLIIT